MREPDGGYTVFVPALPGCITYGESVDEAMEMAKEAISLYVEDWTERGETIPDDSNTLEYSLNLVAWTFRHKKGTFLAILKQAGIDIHY